MNELDFYVNNRMYGDLNIDFDSIEADPMDYTNFTATQSIFP
jgi:hypothetical protein